MQRWFWYAIGSAAAAAVIPILSKLGLKGVDPNAATVVRSVAATITLLTLSTMLGVWEKVHTLWRPELQDATGHTPSSVAARPLIVLTLTGVAGALSWLFYFRALQHADATKVAPLDKLSVPLAAILAVIILGERPSGLNYLGIAMMAVGGWLAIVQTK